MAKSNNVSIIYISIRNSHNKLILPPCHRHSEDFISLKSNLILILDVDDADDAEYVFLFWDLDG